MENKFINKNIKIYFFFTITFLVTIKYGYIYFNTLIGIELAFLLFINKKDINNKNNQKMSYFIFKILVYMYMSYIIILPFMIGNFKFINFLYSINKIIPFILLIQFFEYFNIYDIKKENIRKYCTNLFVIGIIIAMVLFFLGISYIEIGKGIKVTTVSETFNIYKEYRVSGFMSHKSRMGIYCILSLALVSKNYKKSIRKYLTYILIFVVSFLSSSLTTFIGLMVIFITPIVLKNFYKFIKNLKNKQININNCLIIIIIISAIIIGLNIFIKKYESVFGVRDFSTLGSRTNIWTLALEYIKRNPYGIIKIDNNFRLSDSAIFANGHNLFFNEFIESGYLGGILFIIICIYIFFLIEDNYMKFVYLTILSVAQIDMMIYNEMPYILWGVISLYLLPNKIKKIILEE